jgi:transcriptional regulator with XRE-family HTH domain
MLEQPAFGHRLKALRLERGLTQVSLADGILSAGYLSRLESGERTPTPHVVERLAERLGVPVARFETVPGPLPLARILAKVTSTDPDPALADALAGALRADDDGNPALRWQALWLLARMRGDQGRRAEERTLLAELVTLSEELRSAELTARAHTRLAGCAQTLGDTDAARRHAETAYHRSDGLSPADRAAALHALVSAEAEAGRLSEARAHADELTELTERTGGPAWIRALWAAATVRTRQGDHDGTREVLERALRGLDSHEDLTLWMRLRLAAASLYLQVSPPLTDRAAAMLEEVAPVLGLIGTELHRQQALTLRAHLAFEEGRVQDARSLCDQVDDGDLRLSFRDRIRFQALRSRLLMLGGRIDEGIRALRGLAEETDETRNVELAAEIWRDLAQALADAYGKGDSGPGEEGRRPAVRS